MSKKEKWKWLQIWHHCQLLTRFNKASFVGTDTSVRDEVHLAATPMEKTEAMFQALQVHTRVQREVEDGPVNSKR